MAIVVNWTVYDNFTRGEFVCRCGCNKALVHQELVDRLQSMRYDLGGPLVVTSGYRCPEYNDHVSSTGLDGPHVRGKAADLKCYGEDAHKILRLAFKHGFQGVGIAQEQGRDYDKRFIHLDLLTSEEYTPRPWVWSY